MSKKGTSEFDHLKRQLQIEAALEKVRARTMKMRHSEELSAAAAVLFKQLRKLGGNLWSCGFVLLDSEKKEAEFRMTDPKGKIEPTIYIPNTGDPATKRMYAKWREGAEYYSEKTSGDKLKKHYDYMLSLPKSGHVFQAVLHAGIAFPTWQQHHAAYFSHGYLIAITLEPWEDQQLLKRFSKVFEQTYTRFLDLQKAEAQAREAQIEAALERVRSRTMGMQHSDELAEVAAVLFQQFKELGVPTGACGFGLLKKGEKDGEYWMTNPEGDINPPLIIPNTRDPVTRNLFDHWKKGADYYTQEAGGKALQKHVAYLKSLPKNRPAFQAISDAGIDLPTWQQWHAAYFDHGYLLIITLEPYREAELLRRFAKVFDQTYTRFLDLQKAEAQAREAQVEVALERVRFRSLAMHKSDELREVVAVLYEQMIPLGFAALGCELILCDEQNEELQYWSATPEQAQMPECYPIPRAIHPFFQQVWQAWEKRAPRLVVTLKGLDKRKFDKLIFEKTAFKSFPESAKKSIQAGKVDVFSLVTMKYGLLEAVDAIPLPEDKFPILERFANVFEQTYTRFLDLQKAEAQAREAQIEAALERMRARMSSMNHSAELQETTQLMHQEFEVLISLPEEAFMLISVIDRESSKAITWTVGDALTEMEAEQYQFHLNRNRHLKRTFDAWKQGDDLIIRDLKGKELKEFIEYLLSLQSLQASRAKRMKTPLPERLVWSEASFTHGLLGIANPAPLPEESLQILKRFAKIFDQTYTRFLDLKKAEAQAREAQVETALERIRARTMAMHKTSELREVIDVLVQAI